MNSVQKTTNIPILWCPQIRGDVQTIRNLLKYLEVEYQEKQSRLMKNSENQFNSGSFGLELDGFVVHDCISTFRHLCRYYQRTDLLGLTPQNKAVINEFLFKFTEIRSKIIRRFSEAARMIAFDKENAYNAKLGALKQILEQDCKILKSFIYSFMKSRTWVLGYLTIADFYFYQISFYLVNFFGSIIENHMIYRNIKTYKTQFESQDFMMNMRDHRKIFPPFKEKTTLDIISNAWEGDKDIVA